MKDVEANGAVALLASALNLAPHYVGRGQSRYLVHGPADMEAHRDATGALYVVDTSRLMPPLPPTPGAPRGSHLARLMRPELVQAASRPVSSDAFTGFGAHNAAVHNADARAAAALLMDVRLPALAASLEGNADALLGCDEAWVRSAARSEGVNLHLLGHVRAAMASPALRATLLTMMVSRAAAGALLAVMRAACAAAGAETGVPAGSAELRAPVAAFLSELVSAAPAAPLWAPRGSGGDGGMRARIAAKFAGALSAEEAAAGFDLRARLMPRLQLLLLTCARAGVRLARGVAEALGEAWDGDATGAWGPGGGGGALRPEDIAEVAPRVRTPSPAGALQVYQTARLSTDAFEGLSEEGRGEAMRACVQLARVAGGGASEGYVSAAIAAALAGCRGATPGDVVAAWAEVRAACAAVHGELHVKTLMATRNGAARHALGGDYAAAVPPLRFFCVWARRLCGSYAPVVTAAAQAATYTVAQGGLEHVLEGLREFAAADAAGASLLSSHQNHPSRALLLGSFVRRVAASLAPPGAGCVDAMGMLEAAGESVFGEGHVLNAGILLTAARNYNAMGDGAAAQRALDRAITLQTLAFPAPEAALPMVDTLAYAGILASRRGDGARAAAQFARAIATAEAGLAPGSVDDRGAPVPRPALSLFVFFPMIYGELAVLQAGAGGYGAGAATLARGLGLLSSMFGDDPGLPDAVAAVERYRPGVEEPAPAPAAAGGWACEVCGTENGASAVACSACTFEPA